MAENTKIECHDCGASCVTLYICQGCGEPFCDECASAGETRDGRWYCNSCCDWGDEIVVSYATEGNEGNEGRLF